MLSLLNPKVVGALVFSLLLASVGAYVKGRVDGRALESAACARAALARQQQYERDLGEVQDRYAQSIAAHRSRLDALRKITEELADAPVENGSSVCLDLADTERLRAFFARTAEQLGAPARAR